MPAAECEKCNALFEGRETEKDLALSIEQAAQQCHCEKFSVGENSPGPVLDGETVDRLVINPTDVDGGEIRLQVFLRAESTGISVVRSRASDDEVRMIIEDCRIGIKHSMGRTLLMVCRASVEEIRRSCFDADLGRVFCVYDQTVPRPDSKRPPVPTHAGIFMRRDFTADKTKPKLNAEANRKRRDYALDIRELFIKGRINVRDYREGAFVEFAQEGNTGTENN